MTFHIVIGNIAVSAPLATDTADGADNADDADSADPADGANAADTSCIAIELALAAPLVAIPVPWICINFVYT